MYSHFSEAKLETGARKEAVRVLLIKMSSMGDVVHALVGVTDATRAHPGIAFDWVVEEPYQEIPKWHPSVQRVIPIALRRWRRGLFRSESILEWRRFLSGLRQTPYDLILDAQGLYKSALVGQFARGPVVGRSYGSAREAGAALLYSRRCAVDLQRTEVEQLRELFASSLQYRVPQSPADFGIDLERVGQTTISGPYAVLIHGAGWPTKLWPEPNWISVAQELRRHSLKVLLPWGNEVEKRSAEGIAKACAGQVLPKMEIRDVAAVLVTATLVVGLDTGLTHIAVALGAPTITLYGPSVPVFDQIARGNLIMLSSSDSKKVDTSRPNTVALERVLDSISTYLDVKADASGSTKRFKP